MTMIISPFIYHIYCIYGLHSERTHVWMKMAEGEDEASGFTKHTWAQRPGVNEVSRTQSGITYVSEISLGFTAHSRLRQRGSKNKSRMGSDTFLNMAFQTRGSFAHSWYLKIRHLQLSRLLWKRNGKSHHQTKKKLCGWGTKQVSGKTDWSTLTSLDTGTYLQTGEFSSYRVKRDESGIKQPVCGFFHAALDHLFICTLTTPCARPEIHQNIESTQPSRWQHVACVFTHHKSLIKKHPLKNVLP